MLLELLCVVTSYFNVFGNDCHKAIQFCNTNRDDISQITDYLQHDSRLAMAIVAPELSQYSNFFDMAQIYALKVLYVQGQISDFSIGPFQMKPTFAESIEWIVNSDDKLYAKYKSLMIYGQSAREIRAQRVDRLSDLKWQIIYLSPFVDIVNKQLSLWQITDTTGRIRYSAALYNAGLNSDKNRIELFLQKKQFPRASQQKFNYSEIAIEFYGEAMYCPYLSK